MGFKDKLSVGKIETPQDREMALDVLSVVYQDEKGWVPERENLLPVEDLERSDVSWFLAKTGGKALGVTRVLYTIPVDLYRQYAFDVVDKSLDVEAFINNNRIAEVGRFAVIPKYRNHILVSAILMRAAATETVEKGYTHYITDVFEEDPNSPYGFHQRVLGFQTVATHEKGELKVKSRRITMLLDLKEAFQRLSRKRNWVFRFITSGWPDRTIRMLGMDEKAVC